VPNLSNTIRGRSFVAVVAEHFGEVQGKHRRPSKCWYPSPSRRIEVFDCERSDDAVSGASNRAEVKDAVCCGAPGCEILRRKGTPTRLVRSSRVTRNAGVPLESRSRSTVKVRVEQCSANKPASKSLFISEINPEKKGKPRSTLGMVLKTD